MTSKLLALARQPILYISNRSLLNYSKYLKFSTQIPVYLGRNNLVFGPKIVENPSIDDKDPDLPPSNPGEPDLPPPQKTSNVILFPWKYNDQKPRLTEPTYYTSPSFEKLPFVPRSFNLPIARYITSLFFRSLSPDNSYFKGEFLHGARLAFERISYCITHQDYNSMEGMMSEKLYQKYSKVLKNLTEQGGKVKIEVLESHFPEIIETFVTFGNPRGLNLHDKEFFPLFFKTNTVIFSRNVFKRKGMDKNYHFMYTELSSGFKGRLYVKVPAKVKYVLEDKDGIIIDHVGKYDHIIVMTSQQFLPTPAGSIKPDQWEWEVEDIDYLIEEEDCDEKTRQVELHFDSTFLEKKS